MSVPFASTSALRSAFRNGAGPRGRVSPHVVPRRAIRRATGRFATGEHAETDPRGAGFVVEAPVFERDDHLGHRQPRLSRQQELRARRVDLGLECGIRKLDPHPPLEVGAPPADDLLGVGHAGGVHRDVRPQGQEEPQAGPVSDGKQERGFESGAAIAPGLERVVARVALRDDLHRRHVVGDRPSRRRTRAQDRGSAVDEDRGAVGVDGGGAPHDERGHERGGRLVHDLDDGGVRCGAVHLLHRVAAGHAHRRRDDGHAVDQRLPDRHLFFREVPAIVGADPPGELPAGAFGSDRADVVDHREAVATEEAHEMTRSSGGVAPSSRGHRRPCSSGFASRNISSETRSAGRRPS